MSLEAIDILMRFFQVLAKGFVAYILLILLGLVLVAPSVSYASKMDFAGMNWLLFGIAVVGGGALCFLSSNLDLNLYKQICNLWPDGVFSRS